MGSLAVLGIAAIVACGAQAAGMCASVAPLTAADSETGIGAPRYLPLRWLSLGTSITWYNSHAGGKFEKGYQSWLMEQIMWQSFDKRLAAFLLEESSLNRSDSLTITHEAIANHLGSAREVVTRMLRYFQQEGFVALSRGVVTLTDKAALQAL